MWWPLLELTLTAENLFRIFSISSSVVGESILMCGLFTSTLWRSGTSRLSQSLLNRTEKQCFSVWKYSDLKEVHKIVISFHFQTSLWLSYSVLAYSCRWCSWCNSYLKARYRTANYYSLPGQIPSPSSSCCRNSASSSWLDGADKALAILQDPCLTSLGPHIDLGIISFLLLSSPDYFHIMRLSLPRLCPVQVPILILPAM